MTLPLPLMLLDPFPGNLSDRATRDYLRILRRSLQQWGLHTALQTRNRLLKRCNDIRAGKSTGHRRQDVATRIPFLYINEHPFVVVYDPQNRQVIRILHEAQNMPRLLR